MIRAVRLPPVVVDRRRRHTLLVIAAVPALVLWALLPAPVILTGDHGVKVLQTRALLEHRRWPRVIPYPGRTLDPDGTCLPTTLVRVPDGVVSTFPVLYSILLALPMAIGGAGLIPIVPLLGALAAAVIAGRIAVALGAPRRACAAATTLAATPLLFYAVVPWEHSLGTALALGSVLAIIGGRDTVPSPRHWAAWGALIGTAIWLRSELAVVLAVGVIALIGGSWRRRLANTGAAAVSALSSMALGGIVQHAAIGIWLPVHLTHNLALGTLGAPTLTTRLAMARLCFVRDALSGAALSSWVVAVLIALFLRRRAPRLGVAAAIAAFALCCANSFVAPAIRLVSGASPTDALHFATATTTWFFASALPAAILGWSDPGAFRRSRVVAGATACWLVIAVAALGPEPHFFQWGPRYALTAAPLLAALLFAIPEPRAPAARTIRWMRPAAIAGGCLLQLLGLLLEHHVAWGNESIVRAMAEHTAKNEVVVTTTHFIPEVCERLWEERVFLYCRDRSGLESVRRHIAAQGIKRWVLAFVDDSKKHAEVDDLLSTMVDRGGHSRPRIETETVNAATRRLRFYRYTLSE